ncbi:RNA polymerase sigma-70 factor, ECF subfamily [Chitinophaga sp. CF118]|uniref:RNA polymerase sigma factor n=1 Tax=Chitinophaga sp. CF118 TaxID=1884367 RepID=UPI0008F171BF|nr:RNA polymerase sigma-70 factor [Chitinophaga sp. CF118]SFE40736.1 RNA polymerase sigma-70 factor, ECF subfamily [Chitinophaga sp. CF118]
MGTGSGSMLDTLHNEKELWHRCAAGDEMAFTTLFYHYNRLIYPFVLQKVRSETIAEEIIQDTFLKLWTGREHIALLESPDGYLFRIAANRTLDYLRKQAREQHFLDRYIDKTPEQAEDPEKSIYYNETRKAVEEAIQQLPSQRQTIYLLRQEGLSYSEIAEKLGISPNTVRNQLVSAMQFIRTFIQEKGISILVLFSLWKNY